MMLPFNTAAAWISPLTEMKNMPDKSHPLLFSSAGLSMIELGVVLVIIGLVMFAGISSWGMIIESRQMSRTSAALHQAGTCLLERMHHSLQYPEYSTGLQTYPDNPSVCMDSSGARDVDVCLCAANTGDAWGNRLRYLEGVGVVNGTDVRLQGTSVFHRPHHGEDIEETVELSQNSSAMTEDGIKSGIAFILLSTGRDGFFDDPGYADCFEDSSDIVGSLMNCSPDFSRITSDQFLIITGHRIFGSLSK